MNDDFTTAMRRSLALTRAGDPGAATRAIQDALHGRAPMPDAPVPDAPHPAPHRRPSAEVEDAEIVATRPPRRPLGRVVADLAARARAARPAATPAGEQAGLARRRFDGPCGGRDYRLSVPDAGPVRGLIVMLHGCTQSPEDFAAGTAMAARAGHLGFAVAWPEQPRARNAQLCWNWFRPEDQGASAGEPAILAGLARALADEFALPTGRIFAAGLSAGGAMAAILGATHPDLFAAVGVHSGLAAGSAHDVMSAFAAMRGDPGRSTALPVPAIVFQGTADATVAASNAARIAGPLTGARTRDAAGTGRRARITTGTNAADQATELWMIEGAGHAWAGGSARGSYTDPSGPDATAEMLRFFEARMPG